MTTRRLTRAAVAGIVIGLASALGGQAQPMRPPTVIDGVVDYPWQDGVPAHIYCTPGMTCDVELLPGDIIDDIVCPKSVKAIGAIGWIVEQSSPGGPTYLYLTPSILSPTTDLIIKTRHRRYVMLLIAQPSTHLSYAFVSSRGEDASASPAPIPSPSPLPMDYDFTLIGSAPFWPTLTKREGDVTYIRLGDGLYPQPDVQSFDIADGYKPTRCPAQEKQTGRMAPVGWETAPHDTRMIVVKGLYPALVIYAGEGSSQRCFYLLRRTVAQGSKK